MKHKKSINPKYQQNSLGMIKPVKQQINEQDWYKLLQRLGLKV